MEGPNITLLLYCNQILSPVIGQLQLSNVDKLPLETRSNIIAFPSMHIFIFHRSMDFNFSTKPGKQDNRKKNYLHNRIRYQKNIY